MEIRLPIAIRVASLTGTDPTYKEWKYPKWYVSMEIGSNGTDPTYKEWKLVTRIFLFFENDSTDPTYKEWKF